MLAPRGHGGHLHPLTRSEPGEPLAGPNVAEFHELTLRQVHLGLPPDARGDGAHFLVSPDGTHGQLPLQLEVGPLPREPGWDGAPGGPAAIERLGRPPSGALVLNDVLSVRLVLELV